MNAEPFDKKALQSELKAHAKALAIPAGAAEIFVDRTVNAVEKSFQNKKFVTENDLKRAVYKELKKYHPDFAYVYKNYDKII